MPAKAASALGVKLGLETQSMSVGLKSANVIQNALTADRLRYARQIRLEGDAYGGELFDGSKDIEIQTVVERLTNEELEELLK